MTPRATYRCQFHKDFTFAAAERIVPYLDRLGIGHLYASPITTAASGSTHGYDVVDPTRVNPELGGEAGLRALVASLRGRGMGLIIDIVPNHMGVAGGENAWWRDVLAHGRDSRFATYFDIDWRDRMVLPVLGAPLPQTLSDGAITVERGGAGFEIVAYGEHRFPVRVEDHAALEARVPIGDDLAALLDRQHYRLAHWRVANDELNWRRFFTINDLAGLRVEDSEVFEATHGLILRLYGEGLIDGVRVDHIDGLTDPAGYCRTLRARLDATARPHDVPPGPAYIVVEKILASGEALPADWGVDGTSGYDFMAEVTALLHDPAGEAPLSDRWNAVSDEPPRAFEEAEFQARQDMLSWAFQAQLAACVEAFVALAGSTEAADGVTEAMLRRAIERALWVFPVYRTYGTGDAAPASDRAIRDVVRARVDPLIPPGETAIIELVLAWLAGEGPGDGALAREAVRRFQQLSAPIAAKAVEDTAFYREGRLLSLNDVGSDATRFALSIDDFMAAVAVRTAAFPHAMLTTATHDHKRGEDARARLAVMSELPGDWAACVARWEALAFDEMAGVHPADRYMLYQTLLGAWPVCLAADDDEALAAFANRVAGWQQKALREGKQRSNWQAPDGDREASARALLDRLLDPARSRAFIASMRALVERIAAPTLANALVQTALRCTLPGVPDLYQGAELLDLSMVDPDNRRPVDYARRHAVLAGEMTPPGAEKLHLIAHLLAMRRAAPALFAHGGLHRIAVTGARSAHVLAFCREHDGRRLVCAVALRLAVETAGGDRLVPDGQWWGDTVIGIDGGLAARDAFAQSPIHVAMTGIDDA